MEISQKLLDEFKDLMKKRGRVYKTDGEARIEAQRLVDFFEIVYDQTLTDQRRKQRLKKEKIKGFFLDDESDSYYTCAICRESYQGNDIWWNTKGLRCRDCWINIQKKVISSLDYDSDDKVWIKEWQLQYNYGLHPSTRNKLRRQGVLKGRDLKRANGTIYCTVYLIKENQEFLKKYPKIDLKIKMTISDKNGKPVKL